MQNCSQVVKNVKKSKFNVKKGISALKAFLTKRYDIFRAPYAPAPLTIKRQFAFCRTTSITS
ncbi:MAG: virulence-associated E family protein [Hassallia sp. WJT32-NPBG1]|jgi:predicted P-loop ATPase|nr:virulence-associated E family protein [Hassallia sp. WJT32-NPBG1]